MRESARTQDQHLKTGTHGHTRTHRETDIETDRETERQTDRQTESETNTAPMEPNPYKLPLTPSPSPPIPLARVEEDLDGVQRGSGLGMGGQPAKQ